MKISIPTNEDIKERLLNGKFNALQWRKFKYQDIIKHLKSRIDDTYNLFHIF